MDKPQVDIIIIFIVVTNVLIKVTILQRCCRSISHIQTDEHSRMLVIMLILLILSCQYGERSL